MITPNKVVLGQENTRYQSEQASGSKYVFLVGRMHGEKWQVGLVRTALLPQVDTNAASETAIRCLFVCLLFGSIWARLSCNLSCWLDVTQAMEPLVSNAQGVCDSQNRT